MNRESRKARRDSCVIQRPRRPFSASGRPLGGVSDELIHATTSLAVTRRDIVRDGLLGFLPTSVN